MPLHVLVVGCQYPMIQLPICHKCPSADKKNKKVNLLLIRAAHRGATGEFCPGLQPERGPRKGPLNTDLDTLIEQSRYSSEEQCSKLTNKEIWLVRGSNCHCQHVMTFLFVSSIYSLGEVMIQNGNLLCPWGATLTLCPGPLNFSEWPCCKWWIRHSIGSQYIYGKWQK